MVGKKVVEGLVSCRGADLTNNLYLGQFDLDSTPELVKAYIEKQGVTVVELEELVLQHRRFRSFRLCLKRTDMEVILAEGFWPIGVVVRRFWRKKSP